MPKWYGLQGLIISSSSSSAAAAVSASGAAVATAAAAASTSVAAEAAAAATAAAGSGPQCSQPEMITLLLRALRLIVQLGCEDWSGVDDQYSYDAQARGAHVAAAVVRILRLQEQPTPQECEVAAAGAAAAGAAAAAVVAPADLVRQSEVQGLLRGGPQPASCSALTPADMHELRFCFARLVARLNYKTFELVSLGDLVEAAMEDVVTEDSSSSSSSAVKPLQQQLHGLMVSAAKLAESQNARSDWEESDVNYAVSVVQHTESEMFMKEQQQPQQQQQQDSPAGGAVTLSPAAVPWLLLVSRCLRIRALGLQRAASAPSAASALAMTWPNEAGMSASRLKIFVQPLRVLHKAIKSTQVAAVQLLACLEVLEQDSAVHQADLQQHNPQLGAGSSSSSSSVDVQQLAHLSAVCRELRDLTTNQLASAFAAVSQACRIMASGFRAMASTFSINSSSSSSSSSEPDEAASPHALSADQLRIRETFEQVLLAPGLLLKITDDLAAALPVPCCCNNPGCSSLAGPSEQQLAAGKGCVCARCKTAR
jgi:hypothetical protein